MKTLKIMVCSLLVLCGGLLFAACGEKKSFSTDKIIVDSQHVFTYNGETQVVGISYSGVNANVTYALADDKDNFKSASELGLVDAGTYEVYYRLSAKGYKSYTSKDTLELTIQPKVVDVTLEDKVVMKSLLNNKFSMPKSTNGFYNDDDKDIVFKLVDNIPLSDLVAGQSYEVSCELDNPNYILNVKPHKDDENNRVELHVQDVCHVNKLDGSKAYFSKIQDAVSSAVDGETVVLNSNTTISKPITITSDIVIDGCSHQIKAASSFETNYYASRKLISLINVFEDDAKVTLKDVTLDGNNLARCISAFSGNVTISGNTTIKNGNKVDNWRSGGVFITNDATFNMTSGNIVDNNANDEEYTKYCADLWIGANAEGLMNSSITGGKVENVFVNANSFSASDAGKFILNGGKIDNIYVEYDSGYGANFEYLDGEIGALLVSMKNNKCNYYGTCVELTPVAGTTYVGGQLVYEQENSVKEKTYNTVEDLRNDSFNAEKVKINFKNCVFNLNINDLLIDDMDYMFEGCTFNTAVDARKEVGLIFNDCEFKTSKEGETNLYVTSAKNLIVNNCTFEGNITDANAINANLYSTICKQILISNNLFNTTTTDNDPSDNVTVTSFAISVKTRLGETRNEENILIDFDRPIGTEYDGKAPGEIADVLVVGGNNFNSTNSKIEIGVKPQGGSTAPNSSTGNFNVVVDDNKDDVTVYNRFKDNAYTADTNASRKKVEAGSTYVQNKAE